MEQRNHMLMLSILIALLLGCSRGPVAGREYAGTPLATQERAQPEPAATEPIPAATIDPSVQRAWESLGTLAAPSSAPSPDATPPTAKSLATSPPPQPELQGESEVDAKRRVGTEEFARAVAALSAKADQADVAWNRFLEGCRANVTSVTAVAGVADRDWIVFAGANTTTTQWTEACAEAGTFFALVRQVRDGMCVAEDRARQMWVFPGTRRDIRHRYRLNWEGWDAACQ